MKQNSSKKEVYSNTNVSKKIQKKISYEQPNLIPKGTRKRRTKKIQTQEKQIINIRVEKIKIETKRKKQQKRFRTLRASFLKK